LTLAVPARHGGCGRPAVTQTLLQFICGYHDVDLRDSTGLGHGRLIAEHATSQVRDRWLPRLLNGAIPGIAITEPHGGSQVHSNSTTAKTQSGRRLGGHRDEDLGQPPDRGGDLLRVLH
jgi:alkylation response protein AidB-like acyl-CoA dehydrogenase